MDVGEFSRDFMNAFSIDAEALGGGKSFAGDFQQDALKDRSRQIAKGRVKLLLT